MQLPTANCGVATPPRQARKFHLRDISIPESMQYVKESVIFQGKARIELDLGGSG
jgi:hypothetical protein